MKDKLDKMNKDLHILKCRDQDKVDKSELKRFQANVKSDVIVKADFDKFKKQVAMDFERSDAERQMGQVKAANDNNSQTTLNNEIRRDIRFLGTQVDIDKVEITKLYGELALRKQAVRVIQDDMKETVKLDQFQ